MASQHDRGTDRHAGSAIHAGGESGLGAAMIAIGVLATLVVLAFYLLNAA